MKKRKNSSDIGASIIAEALKGRKSISEISKICNTNWETVKTHLTAAEKAGILKHENYGKKSHYVAINELEIPDFLVHYGTCCYCNERNILVAHFNYNESNNHCYCEECLEDALITLKWKKRHQVKNEQRR